MLTIVAVLCCLTSLAIFKFVTLLLNKRRNAKEAIRRGCQPAPTVPSKGLFGIKTLMASINATKEDRGVQWIKHEMDTIGEHVHTVRATIFDYELFLTRDTENVKAMFATQSSDFDIGPHREKMFKDLFGLGVMTTRGQAWKHSRGLIRPQFARDQIMNVDMLENHVQALVRRIGGSLDSDGWTDTTDLQPLFYNLTLDVSTEFLLGQSVHSQDPTLQARLALSQDPKAPLLSSFGKSLDAAKAILDRRGALAKYGWLMNSWAFQNHCKTVQTFVDYFVQKKLESLNEKNNDVGRESERFVLLHELAKDTKDPLTLRNEVLNVLHAARDTTAALQSWVFYFLARRPEIFSKLRQEVLATFPGQSPDEMTFTKIWGQSYMLQVLNETIRYVGIVPMNERAAVVDTTLPRGGGPDGNAPVFIPKGTQVLVPTYSMQHREDIWGADVEEYKPERWEGKKFGWDFVPFGGGARQCIGQQFARTEAMYSIIRILQRFDRIENMEPPGQPMRFHHTIENRSGTGVQVRLHAAIPPRTEG